MNAVVHIEERIVGIFIARVEMRVLHVPRLLDGHGCAAFAVERETHKPGVCNAIEPDHGARRFSAPHDGRCCRIFSGNADANARSQHERLRNAIRAVRKEQDGRVSRLSEFVQALLNGRRIVCRTIGHGAVDGFHIGPAGKGSDKLVTLGGNRRGG